MILCSGQDTGPAESCASRPTSRSCWSRRMRLAIKRQSTRSAVERPASSALASTASMATCRCSLNCARAVPLDASLEMATDGGDVVEEAAAGRVGGREDGVGVVAAGLVRRNLRFRAGRGGGLGALRCLSIDPSVSCVAVWAADSRAKPLVEPRSTGRDAAGVRSLEASWLSRVRVAVRPHVHHRRGCLS
jgi:hypothetical protein